MYIPLGYDDTRMTHESHDSKHISPRFAQSCAESMPEGVGHGAEKTVLIRTSCATATQLTCWRPVQTYALFNCYSGMQISRPRPSICMFRREL
jgi:hypothetical protein